MYITKGSVVECDTCQVLAVSHLVTGLYVGAVCDSLYGEYWVIMVIAMRQRHRSADSRRWKHMPQWHELKHPYRLRRSVTEACPPLTSGSLIAICGVTRQSTMAILTWRLTVWVGALMPFLCSLTWQHHSNDLVLTKRPEQKNIQIPDNSAVRLDSGSANCRCLPLDKDIAQSPHGLCQRPLIQIAVV